jgi:hypothetical protein
MCNAVYYEKKVPSGSSRDFGTREYCDVWTITITFFVFSLYPTSEGNYMLVLG